MKKVVNDRYQETYVEETLENGLRVVLWQKKDYVKSLFMLATPFGAFDMEQEDEQGNQYSFPAGIAHFLEHKMFEMKDKDVMDLFSKMGAHVNAFTSYNETAYYFSTSNEEVKEPLCLLLDFVQQLQISEQSVEKEKGIIVQELNMYQQMSEMQLLMETFSSLYQEHPLKYDIGGDEAHVRGTTLEQLEECYELNYHPSRMILVGVSSQDPKKLMEIIKENQAKKVFKTAHKITRKKVKEPKTVAKETVELHMNVHTPKVCVAYKLEGILEPYQRAKQEWAIKMMLDAYFSSLNPNFQTWLDEKIINDYVGCEIEYGQDYGMLMFYGETENTEAFEQVVQEVVEQIKKGYLEEEKMEQLKRRYFGQSIRALNSFDDIAISFVRATFANMNFFDGIDVLYDIDCAYIKEVCQKLDVTNQSKVTLLSKV